MARLQPANKQVDYAKAQLGLVHSICTMARNKNGGLNQPPKKGRDEL